MIEDGLGIADVALPKTRPQHAEQLRLLTL